jgi:DNA-binding transcriptional MerR regulator
MGQLSAHISDGKPFLLCGDMREETMASKRDQMPQEDLDAVLASKPFFKIGEVAKLLRVKPHVLRYWETEFASIRPKKNPSGQRIYVRADIEAIVEIQNLLYNERYTISGARQMLSRQRETPPNHAFENAPSELPRALATLKEDVYDVLALLEKMPMI